MPLVKTFVDDEPNRDRLLRQLVETNNKKEGFRITTKTHAAANTTFSVTHGLGRKPMCAVVEKQTKAGTLYWVDEHRWNKRVAFFRYSESADTITIRLE